VGVLSPSSGYVVFAIASSSHISRWRSFACAQAVDNMGSTGRTHSIRPVVVFAMHTGMRKAEIFNLAWNDVDLEQRVLRVADSKNGQHRFIPINSRLHSLLKMVQEYRSIEDPRVFWNVVNFRKLWDAAIRRAKIVAFRFHDLRHTFASYMAMAGVDLKTIQEILGHKSFAMTLRYAHLSASHKHAAVEKLSNALGGNEVEVPGESATQVQHGPQVAV
ncbi:MAG TPA: site-specific integrase, partial [Planctomycetota bacterium]|nr:site-specific integrase [Planctomycetota bacterium]